MFTRIPASFKALITPTIRFFRQINGRNMLVPFRVRARVAADETVCVSGNCAALGLWEPDRVFPLEQQDTGIRDVWSGEALIQEESSILYRYLICTLLDSADGNKKCVIRRWEANLKPRELAPHESQGEIEVAEFGNYDGKSCTQKGWLTAETLIQFKLYNNPLQIWKRELADRKLNIQVSAIALPALEITNSVEENGFTKPSSSQKPCVEISVMNNHECQFRKQNDFGRTFMPDEYLLFQTQLLSAKNVGFKFSLYLCDPNCKDPSSAELVGFSHVLSSTFTRCAGISVVPVLGVTLLPIGQIVVDYLLVRPMKEQICNLAVSYKTYWNRERGAVEVGHRGSGSSFKEIPACASIRENTVASFVNAANEGADFVEFDVQLTKDKIPVIYHDFSFCVSSKKRETVDGELIKLQVHDFTLQQLQALKIHHGSEEACSEKLREFATDDQEDARPFPTLADAFAKVPQQHLGFNVEVKWPMLKLDDLTPESPQPLEMNEYLDVIIKTVMESAGSRRVVYSCFDPDVCTMLHHKQNKYPVLMLTQGETKRWYSYVDPRTRNIPMAIHFARSSCILGIDVHTEEILANESLVQSCLDAGLIMFCWGEDNNDTKVISKLKKLGLHGIIYDGIDVFKTEKQSIFLC